jgi:hypothetical protein
MDQTRRFQQLAGVSCLLAGACYVGGAVLMAAAVNFNLSLDAFSSTMIAVGPRGAELLRWGLLLDGLGSYLLLAPLALYLWGWLKPENVGLANLYTLSGLAYMLVGAIGAFVLAAALPPLINAYGAASAAQRETLQVVFNTIFNAVYRGLWNPLEVLLLAAWLLGLGPWIARTRPALGRLTQLVGLLALLDAVGRFLGLEPLFMVGVSVLLALLPLWLLWWGIELLRRLPRTAGDAGAS